MRFTTIPRKAKTAAREMESLALIFFAILRQAAGIPAGAGRRGPTGRALPGPVIVGGMGGSGTRVVAAMLLDMGFHLGDTLNPALDNLCFTLLLRRPRWLARLISGGDEGEIFRGLRILEKTLTGRPRLRAGEIVFILRAIAAGLWEWPPDPPLSRIKGFIRNIRHGRGLLCETRGPRPGAVAWGFKEPNVHACMGQALSLYPCARYIHVVRHGLDMAFTRMTRQTRVWAPLLGYAVPEDPALFPRAALKCWIGINRRTLAAAERRGADRVLVLNFDRLCLSPREETERIVSFLAPFSPRADLGRLCTIPRIPSSLGRHRDKDLGIFDADDLAAVRTFGFEIDGPRGPGADPRP